MTRSSSILVLSTLATVCLLSATTMAQSDMIEFASVEATTTCAGTEVDIHITLNVWDVVDPNITGWIVEREVVGACVDDVDVSAVQPMPTGIGIYEFVVHDVPVVPYRKVIYYLKAVAADSERFWIPFPHRGWFTQADCMLGIAARGTVIDVGGNLHLQVCPDECWWGLSHFDNSFPPNQEMPPLGATIDIYGELRGGMEGPYIDATHWVVAAEGCRVVDNDESSWGSLKARYR